MFIKLLNKSSAQITIDSKLYSSEVVHKCLYWHGSKVSVDIKLEDDLFIIAIVDLCNEDNIEQIINQIKIDLIDFKTREIVSSETKYIREMLIAKAFAYGDEFEEVPHYEQDDTLGLDPSNI